MPVFCRCGRRHAACSARGLMFSPRTRTMKTPHAKAWLGLVSTLALAWPLSGCDGDGHPTANPPPVDTPPVENPPVDPTDPPVTPPKPDPVLGFISADNAGTGDFDAPSEGDSGDGDAAGDDDGGDERTVEEGDIYRVLGDGLLLNLNAYR